MRGEKAKPCIIFYFAFSRDLMTTVPLEPVLAVINTHKVTLGDAYMIAEPDDFEKIADNLEEAKWVVNYIPPGEEPLEPISDIYYPIIEEAIDTNNLFQDGETYAPADHTLGGILSISFYWRDMIRNILPPGSNGIVIVFDNECNPSFTYKIYGHLVTYLGTGDFHDPQYDYLEKSSPLLALRELAIKKRPYSGIPVNEDLCQFHVRLFPSDTMKDDYTSQDSVIFSVSAAFIFVFTSCVFVWYDFWVERRQKLVLSTAEYASGIVSSLFPSSVHDRLFPKREAEIRNTESQRQSDRIIAVSESNDGDKLVPKNSAPIADLFPDATVFFADVV
jgi:hypothetical protein